MWSFKIHISFGRKGRKQPENTACDINELAAGEALVGDYDNTGFSIVRTGVPTADYLCGHWVNDQQEMAVTIYKSPGCHVLSMFHQGRFDYKVPLYLDGQTFKYDHPRGGTKTLYAGQFHKQILISGIGGFERDDVFNEYRKI